MILKSRRQSLMYSDKGRAVVQEKRVLTLISRAHLPSAQEEEGKYRAIVAWRGNKQEGGRDREGSV